MKNCYFVSDLHLFSRRSRGDLHQGAIERAALNADAFVLAGDNFDFHWSTIGTIEESADVAARWLERLARGAPGCEFHALLGNHDHHPALIQRLVGLSAELPNLNWHPYFLRIGSGVFLHGDAANWRMNAEALSRFRDRCAEKSPKHARWNRLYDMAIGARLHVLCARAAFPHRVVARRLSAYLEEIEHGPDNGVRNVYFGHTHRALSDYAFGGLKFHNGGAPMDGLRFDILKADIS